MNIVKKKLLKVIRDYGEEKFAKRIAEFIVDNRENKTNRILHLN